MNTDHSIRELFAADIFPGLLTPFVRTQQITKCWLQRDGGWVIDDAPFLDEWEPDEKREREQNFLRYLEEGGSVFGAFDSAGDLIGFSVLRGPLFGQTARYAELKQLHVSAPWRGHGLGKKLFLLACGRALENSADKLYISAQSSVETQAFYRGLGCDFAAEVNPAIAEHSPIDIQMELPLRAE